MAESEHNPGCDLRNAQVEVGTLFYELRVVIEALSHGLKTLLKKSEAAPVRGELVILENFANQAVDALDAENASLAALLSWRCPETPQA